MRRKIPGLMAAALVLGAVAANPAAAQARGYVGFGGGVSLPMGDFGDGAKTGWLGQVIAGITGPNGRFGGRIDGMYLRHSAEVGDAKSKMIGVNADLVVSPGSSAAKVRPYVLGGVGLVNAKAEVNGVTGDGDTNFAFNLGGGLQFKAGSLGIFLEARYFNVSSDPGSTSFIPIVVGLRFGGS
jgi:opacity protein-like surface antigen